MRLPTFDTRDEGDGPLQVVVVNDSYAYGWPWPDDPLKPGDKVVAPDVGFGEFHVTVTSVGSFYEGKLTRLLRRDEVHA